MVCGLALLVLAACAPESGEFGFHIRRVDTHIKADALQVVVHQTVDLSAEAQQALTHGVPLFIRTEISLRPRATRRTLARAEREFEIRYLPLSDLYQVSTAQPFQVRTFPRLRHVLAAVGTVDLDLGISSPGLPSDDLELRVRCSLNKRHMPPPMRLPAWFSAEWRHDTGWTSWSLDSSRTAG